MEKPNFENYLIDRHAAQYVGLDDDGPDDFDRWLCELEPDDYIKFANAYACEYGKVVINECRKVMA